MSLFSWFYLLDMAIATNQNAIVISGMEIVMTMMTSIIFVMYVIGLRCGCKFKVPCWFTDYDLSVSHIARVVQCRIDSSRAIQVPWPIQRLRDVQVITRLSKSILRP